jgi:hypothetical protein
VSTAAESIAPPHPWMPAIFDLDVQGLPVRHRPGQWRHGDVWESRCDDAAIVFDFSPLREVMALTPCLGCEEAEQP